MKKLLLFSTSKKSYAFSDIDVCEKYFDGQKEHPVFHGSITMNPKRLKQLERGVYEIEKEVFGIK